MALAAKKRGPHDLFQTVDMPAHRRLKGAPTLGGSGDVHLFGDGNEEAQVAGIHKTPLQAARRPDESYRDHADPILSATVM
jgi:hypothetical protein